MLALQELDSLTFLYIFGDLKYETWGVTKPGIGWVGGKSVLFNW